jgi:hypothetical protein
MPLRHIGGVEETIHAFITSVATGVVRFTLYPGEKTHHYTLKGSLNKP